MPTADVVVIGHGLVGATLARCMAEAGVRVMLLEAGSPAAAVPGAHLRNLPACRTDRPHYHDLVRAHLRPASVPRPAGGGFAAGVPQMPDGLGVNTGQRARTNLPGARLTNLHGGMGTLWNCVSPRLHPQVEQWAGIPSPEWDRLYARAEQLLHVSTRMTVDSRRQEFLTRVLGAAVPAPVAAAPVAARSITATGPPQWTGPAEILNGGGSPAESRIVVRRHHAVRRLRHRGGRVVAADAVDLDTGASVQIHAGAFIVAAGAIRTPALLWSSGIGVDGGDASALGRYLCDHALSYAQVVLDPVALGDDPRRPDPDPFVMVPLHRERSTHALLMCDAYDGARIEGRIDDRLLLSLYWYTAVEPRFSNRVRFDLGGTDAIGLPQPTFEYTLDADDRDRQRAAFEELRTVGPQLGTFLPSGPPQIMSPGASMHMMGTTRMGRRADGSSVVDAYGAVWGFSNLYLGGTGLIPTATATNPTLAACALAVRTAERVATTR